MGSPVRRSSWLAAVCALAAAGVLVTHLRSRSGGPSLGDESTPRAEQARPAGRVSLHGRAQVSEGSPQVHPDPRRFAADRLRYAAELERHMKSDWRDLSWAEIERRQIVLKAEIVAQ